MVVLFEYARARRGPRGRGCYQAWPLAGINIATEMLSLARLLLLGNALWRHSVVRLCGLRPSLFAPVGSRAGIKASEAGKLGGHPVRPPLGREPAGHGYHRVAGSASRHRQQACNGTAAFAVGDRRRPGGSLALGQSLYGTLYRSPERPTGSRLFGRTVQSPA